MSFRIAVVQPITNPIEEAEKNIADAERFNRRIRDPREPAQAALYDENDVERTLPRLTPLRYAEPREVAPCSASKRHQSSPRDPASSSSL